MRNKDSIVRNKDSRKRMDSIKRNCGFARIWRVAIGLTAVAVAVLPPRATAQVNTTTVQGTIYRADGTAASGTLLVNWSAFTTPQNQAIAAGSTSAPIGADGFVSLNLMPNANALPAGSYYTAVYHLSDGTVNQEYWVVPASSTASVASVRAQLEPSTEAVQPVSEGYVQSAISSLSGSFLPLAGGALTGPLTLNSDPAAASQAATKHYADQLAAANLPLAGGALTGPLTAPQLYTRQMEGALYADQWQSRSGSNDGIAMSVAECATYTYACRVIAPALYAQMEMPLWSRVNFANYGVQQASVASSFPIALSDYRSGGLFQTIVNPYVNPYPGSTNPAVASQLKVDFTGPPSFTQSPFQNSIGMEFNVNQTQGGIHSQIYDFVHQTVLRNLHSETIRNTSGATSAHSSDVWCEAPGDCVNQEMHVNGPAGDNAPFDEGMELWSDTVSATINVYRGTLTGAPAAGATAVVVAPSGTNASANEQISGTQGENRWLLDTQSGKTTTLTATALNDDVQPFSDNIATCQGVSCNYFTQITPTTSVAPSTAWGSLASAIAVPSGSLTPGTQTFTISTAHGAWTTGLACMADEAGSGGTYHLGNFETIAISATNGSTSVRATMQKSHPMGGTLWQGGLCGQFAEIAGADVPSGSSWSNGESGGTTAYPVRFVWPVLGSVDGTHLILWTGRNDWGPLDSAFNSYANKSVSLYSGAEVYKVVGANNDTTDNHFALAPNNAPWASSDTVEEAQYPYQSANFGALSASQWLPHNGGPRLLMQMLGRPENNDIGLEISNGVAWTSYMPGGGSWHLPGAAFDINGPWNYGIMANTYYLTSLIGLPCYWGPGCGTLQRIVNPGFGVTSDYFGYTNTAGGTGAGGTWSFSGNLSVAGSLRGTGSVTGATINGEVTVDGTTYTTLNAAWSAAVSQANTTGQNQTVRLGPGTFPVTATLTEPTNGACVSVLGSAGATVNADSTQVATTLTVPGSLSGDLFYLGNGAQAQGCTFKDLNILASANATHGFELQWFRGLLIDNVTVNDTTAEGILLGEENTSASHQANFLLRNVTVSYSSAAFTPASRSAYGIHLLKTAIDSHLDDIVVRNAQTAAVYNEGTGNTGYLIHGFGYPYTCPSAPCANNASSGSAANASYATNYVVYDTGGSGSVWTDTYLDSPAIAGFYVGANGVEIHGGHIQWPDVTSFPAANLAYVAPAVSNNLLIADVDCLEMANGVNWITYAGSSGNPPTYASVHHLTGCGNYYQALEDAEVTGYSSGGANVNDPSGAVPRVWSAPVASAASYPAYAAQMYTGYQGDAFQAHFSGASPFFNVTYQGTIRSNGGIALGTIINTASTLTLTAANKNVIANAASGAQTIMLPSCYTPLLDKAAPTGLEFTIVKSDTSSNTVTLQTTSSEMIYASGTSAAALVLSSPSTQTLVCGPDYNWYVAGSAGATISSGGVTSFNGRTGAVAPAANDYSFSQLSGQVTNAQLPSTLTAATSGNASTASALAAAPSQCPTGYYATGVTANGTANCLQSWRFTWYGNFAGTFGTSTNNSLGAIWSPSAGITMTRLDIAIGTAPSGCSTYPVIGVYDSSASTWLKLVTLAPGTYSYRNAVSGVPIVAGHNLSMGVQTAAAGCSTNAGSAQLTMEYTMNQ